MWENLWNNRWNKDFSLEDHSILELVHLEDCGAHMHNIIYRKL
jgi:hypothetical protein